MIITHKTNFIRIFELPISFSTDFCFGGGIPTVFKMVDWFNPYPYPDPDSDDLPPITQTGLEITPDLRVKLNKFISDFVSKKKYAQGKKLLAITNYGDSFIIDNKCTDCSVESLCVKECEK